MRFETEIVGAEQTDRELAAMEARARDLSRPLDLLGHHHVGKAQRVLRSGQRGIQARNPSGLAASLTHRVSGNDLRIGSNRVYAAVQQWGGRIESSRPDGYLAIPAGANIGARGNARFESPTEVEDGLFLRSKAGRLLFVRPKHPRAKTRRRGQSKAAARFRDLAGEAAEQALELLFVLVRSVTIPPHRYVSHDPPDQRYWEQLAGRWLLEGEI